MNNDKPMQLGTFSMSLAVKDLELSKQFYQKLGFSVIGGEASQNWLIMRNGDHNIGLFQGMLPGNILTFNPGWDTQGNHLDVFVDVRQIHKNLVAAGLELSDTNLTDQSGPGHISLVDPDGNAILIDQHR